MDKPLPTPLYCCAKDACCEDFTFTAENLYWSDIKKGFYCDSCWDDDIDLFHEERGITLQEELDRRGLNR